jgi:uncharacterized membrane-anchored protein YitT (DUF2179 family)
LVKKRSEKTVNTVYALILEYILLLIGCLLTAVSFNLFLSPNHIASGGVVGLSVIIRELFGVEPAITQWLVNIPLFAAGLLLLGKKFGLKTAVGSFFLPFFILLTRDLKPLTENLLLAALYGGIGVGTGLGLVFRSKGSIGGFTVIAHMIHKYTGFTIGKVIMALDALVILTAGLSLNAEKALYALIVVFVTGRAIDLVQMGLTYSKVAFVISDHHAAISDAILNELDRGLTKLPGLGGFTGEERTVLMVVMNQSEVLRFKTLVKKQDPHAFIIISDTHEVLGQGFKFQPVNNEKNKAVG